MAIDVAGICAESSEKDGAPTLAVVLSIVFAVYILFDTILGSLTVGVKAWGPLVATRNADAGSQDGLMPTPGLVAVHIGSRRPA